MATQTAARPKYGTFKQRGFTKFTKTDIVPVQNKKGGLALPNNKVLITLKIDKDLKRNLDAFGEEIGVALSTMINALLKKVERTKQLDLSFEEYYTPRPATIKRIEEADKAYLEGRTISMTGVEFGEYLRKLSV